MKYLIREMREVVVVEGLPCIKKWNETFQVLEEGLSTKSSLKAGFEPDTLVMNSLGEIVLLRDEDRGKTIFNREDVITIIKVHNGIEEIGPKIVIGYYNIAGGKELRRDMRLKLILDL